jgi:tartrate-resistant acid phosphatase type 5
MNKAIRAWAPAFVTALIISACSVPPGARDGTTSTAMVTLLAVGDTGYHYDYLEKEDYETVLTEEQFLAKEKQDWIDDKRPIAELAYPPMYRLPVNGSVIAASGQAPVASAMRSYCAQHGCDVAAMLGDNIYPDGATGGPDDAKRFHDLFTVPYKTLNAARPDFRIYAVLGNHDWHTSREGARAQVEFMERTPPFYMKGYFYSVVPPASRGQVEIFALDTEMLLAATTVYESVLADDGSEAHSDEREELEPWAAPQDEAERNMVGWLEQALANSQARWKIVIGHHPLWSSSGGKFEQARALRRLILPVLCRYADMYLAGHEHTLEVHSDDCSAVSDPGTHEPLPQIVSGAGAKMRPINSAFIGHQLRANPQLRTYWSRGLTWGFAHLTFEGDRVAVRMIETPQDGSGVPKLSYEHSFTRRSRKP